MRNIFASVFKAVFRISFLKKYYFGFYKRIFRPYDLFKGVRKKIAYRNGLILSLELEDWIPQNIYFLNNYEEKEMKFIERFLKNGDCFIDIGSNIGLYSLVASKFVGSEGQVIAFEPFKRNYGVIKNHIQLNKLTNITLENLAVSDREGPLTLYLNENEKDYGMVSRYPDKSTCSEKVTAVSIDGYFNNRENRSVELIKIDIEGGEYLALKGMENTLKKHKPVLLIEINPDNGAKPEFPREGTEAFLFGLGYRKYFLNDQGEIVNERTPDDFSNNYIFRVDILNN